MDRHTNLRNRRFNIGIGRWKRSPGESDRCVSKGAELAVGTAASVKILTGVVVQGLILEKTYLLMQCSPVGPGPYHCNTAKTNSDWTLLQVCRLETSCFKNKIPYPLSQPVVCLADPLYVNNNSSCVSSVDVNPKETACTPVGNSYDSGPNKCNRLEE